MKNILKMKKKGQAGAFGQVLGVVLLAVLIIVSIFLFVTLGAGFTDLETITTNNETISAVGHTPQFVDNSTECNFAGFSAIIVTNTTDGVVITSPNYTTTGDGSIGASDDVDLQFNGTDWDVTYSYNWGGESCEASAEMVDQFATYPVLVGLIGTILLLGLVILILIKSFSSGAKGRA